MKDIITNFLKELEAHISLLQQDYDNKKELYGMEEFLKNNFVISNPEQIDLNIYTSFVNLAKANCKRKNKDFEEENLYESVTNECYEILRFFEKTTSITYDKLKEALFTCWLAEKNDVMKEHNRYKDSIKLLNSIKTLFLKHQYRNLENSLIELGNTEKEIIKFKNLKDFLIGNSKIELEQVDSYYIDGTNFKEEDWIEIYNHILLIQIKNYKKEENLERERNISRIEKTVDIKAREMEEKILKSLDYDLVVLEDKEEKENKEKELATLNDPVLLEKFSILKEKVGEYKKYGDISPTKEQSFSNMYESLEKGNTLENIGAAYTPSDYIKFLYYCFKREFSKVNEDMSTTYPKESIDEFVNLLLLSIETPEQYLQLLTEALEKKKKELQEIEKLNVSEVSENKYKLVFFEDNGVIEMSKDLKSYSSEKKQDLEFVLTKIEEGRLQKSEQVLASNATASFKSIRGKLIFVLYRVISNDHILVYKTGNLDEFEHVVSKLNTYDTDVEEKIVDDIRDNGINYNKLMKNGEEFRKNICSSKVMKGGQ